MEKFSASQLWLFFICKFSDWQITNTYLTLFIISNQDILCPEWACCSVIAYIIKVLYKYTFITLTITWPKWRGPLSSDSKLLSALSERLLLCFFFPRGYWLIFKDPIESRYRVFTLWVELHKALFFYFTTFLIQKLVFFHG